MLTLSLRLVHLDSLRLSTSSKHLSDFRTLLERKRDGKSATPVRSRAKDAASPARSAAGTPKRRTPSKVRKALDLSVVSSSASSPVPASPSAGSIDEKHADDDGNGSVAMDVDQSDPVEEDIFENDEPVGAVTPRTPVRGSKTTSSSSKPKSPSTKPKSPTTKTPKSSLRRKRRFA